MSSLQNPALDVPELEVGACPHALNELSIIKCILNEKNPEVLLVRLHFRSRL